MFDYCITSRHKDIEDVGSYKVYGIAAYKMVGGEAVFIDELSDISTDKGKVEDLARHLNKNRIRPFHVPDEVDEWIG